MRFPGMLSIMLCACVSVAAQPAGNTEAHALVEQGNALRDRLDYAGAIAKYHVAIQKDPSHVEALHQLLYAYAETGNFERSLDAALAGSRLSSELLNEFNAMTASNYEYIMAIASDYENLANRSQEDIDEYRRQARSFEDAYQRFFALGLTYWNMGRPAEAIDNLQIAVEIDSSRGPAHLMLARLYHLQRRRVPAIMAFSTFLLLEPESPEAARAQLLLKTLLDGTAYPPPAGAQNANTPFRLSEEALNRATTQLRPNDAPIPRIATQLQALFSTLPSAAPLPPEFSAVCYAPYFARLAREGFIEPFVYHIFSRQEPVAEEWRRAHRETVDAFLRWSSSVPRPGAAGIR